MSAVIVWLAAHNGILGHNFSHLAIVGVSQPINSIKSAGRSLVIASGDKGSVFISFKEATPRAVKVIEKVGLDSHDFSYFSPPPLPHNIARFS